jgi:hypothetical protein
MPRATTNKSMRLDEPKKAMRRRSVNDGEIDDQRRTSGASGAPQLTRKRPGRAASLLGTAQRTRSQKWRNPSKGAPTMRRGVLAKGSRTGRNSGSK